MDPRIFKTAGMLGSALAFSAWGCASMSSFQTAEALPPGEVSIGVGMSSLSMEGKTAEGGTTVTWKSDLPPNLELLVRYGFLPRFDAGLKVYTTVGGMGYVLDGKYQFLDGEGVDGALVLGIATSEANFLFGASLGGTDEDETAFFDYYAAVPFTFRFSESLTLTAAPRYVDRSISSDFLAERERIIGGSLTLSMGKEVQVRPEVGFFRGAKKTEMTFGGLGIVYEPR